MTGKQPATPAECDVIPLRGVRVHNLKGIDVDIPLGKLTVITGVSGSGKSSLAFDTLYAEGQRRYIETFAPAERQHLETLEKPDAESIGQIPPAIALRQNSVSRTRKATVSTVTEVNDLLHALLARSGTVVCPSCGCEVVPQTPASVAERLAELPEGQKFQIAFPFIIDSEVDVAEQLQQLTTSGYSRAVGIQHGLEDSSAANCNDAETCSLEDSIANGLPDSVNELLIIVDRLVAGRTAVERLTENVEACFRDGDGRCVVLSPAGPSDGSEQQSQQLSIDGHRWQLERFSQRRDCLGCGTRFAEPEPSLLSFRSPHGACPDCGGSGSVDEERCRTCFGSRLSLEVRAVRLRSVGDELLPSAETGSSAASWPGLAELEDATVEELLQTIEGLSTQSSKQPTQAATRHLFDAIRPRLRFLEDAGLGYVELNRAMCNLSRGEAQRVALTSILSSQLVNSLFVLDEPSSGLHAADLSRVIELLHRLRDQGNTVVVVEHETDVARAADHVIEIGPGSGASGGNVVFAGPFDRLLEQPESATAKHFREMATSVPEADGDPNATPAAGSVSLTGCRHHTLQNVSVEFPLGCLCVVTGVSGSGKTSLVEQTLYPARRGVQRQGCMRIIEHAFSLVRRPPRWRMSSTVLVTGNLSNCRTNRRPTAHRQSAQRSDHLAEDSRRIRSLFADTPDSRNR